MWAWCTRCLRVQRGPGLALCRCSRDHAPRLRPVDDSIQEALEGAYLIGGWPVAQLVFEAWAQEQLV